MAERTPQKSIVLILARELASKLATPMFVVDPEGTLVYFNEPAEGVLGRAFAETGELTSEEWGKAFDPSEHDGTAIEMPDLPLTIALSQKHPAHKRFLITAYDGARRDISVTAFPLFAREREFVGAVAVFWEESGGSPA